MILKECRWREHGCQPGGRPEAPWQDGRFVGFIGDRAVVSIGRAGYLRICDLNDVLLPP